MKPLASLSLDLDNQWSYMKTHGDSGWETYPSYLERLTPLVLPLLERLGLRITFFVVGQDAARPENADPLAALATSGHEIGNHSFRHEPWMHRYPAVEIASELERAEQSIERATGVCPRGFRGPGYALSASVLRELVRRGYEYDASTFPTWVGPAARAYYFRTARLSEAEREQRAHLFGDARDALRPILPYRWRLGADTLLEIPVTTFPWLRVPIHFSYVLFLATHSPRAARAYFRSALRMCLLTGVEPSILLHPLDFLGADDVNALAFFPGMRLLGAHKREHVEWALAELAAQFRVGPMGEHAAALQARGGIEERELDFVTA